MKNNSNGIKINLKKEEINIIIYKNSNEINFNNKLSKSYRGKNSSLNNKKRYRNTFNGNSINKTIDSNNSNLSNKNGFGSSLDIKKVIKKNKIDSNIIIGIPKLVPINKQIFNMKNKFSKKKLKSNLPLNEYYDKFKSKK